MSVVLTAPAVDVIHGRILPPAMRITVPTNSNHPVLVVNINGQPLRGIGPLGVGISWEMGLQTLFAGRAQALAWYEGVYARSAENRLYNVPSVIQISGKKGSEIAWDDSADYWKHGVFIRDMHRCAYCGVDLRQPGVKPTVDHILPHSWGGPWSWENTVAACGPCNWRKGANINMNALPLVQQLGTDAHTQAYMLMAHNTYGASAHGAFAPVSLPHVPTVGELVNKMLQLGTKLPHPEWAQFMPPQAA